METTEARAVAGRGRNRAGAAAERGEPISHARTAPIENGHTDRAADPRHERHPEPETKKRTRTDKKPEDRTHFSFAIELPIEWLGALKLHSIHEQASGAFNANPRENDAMALLRHVVKSYCEEVIEHAETRRAR